MLINIDFNALLHFKKKYVLLLGPRYGAVLYSNWFVCVVSFHKEQQQISTRKKQIMENVYYIYEIRQSTERYASSQTKINCIPEYYCLP